MPPSQTALPFPPAARKALFILVLVGGLVLLFLAGIGLLVRARTTPEEIAKRLSEKMKTPITYREIGVGWDGRILARGLGMGVPGETPVVEGADLDVRLSWTGLLFGEARPEEVRFEGGTWNVSLSPGGGPLGDFFARNRTAGPLPFGFEIAGARFDLDGVAVEGVFLRQWKGSNRYRVALAGFDGRPCPFEVEWEGDTALGTGRLRFGPADWPVTKRLRYGASEGEDIEGDFALAWAGDSFTAEGSLRGGRLRFDAADLADFEIEGTFERVGRRDRILVAKGVERAGGSPLRFSLDLRRRDGAPISLHLDWDGPTERILAGRLAEKIDLRGRSAGRLAWTPASYEGEVRPRDLAGRIPGRLRFSGLTGRVSFSGRKEEAPQEFECAVAGGFAKDETAPAAWASLAFEGRLREDRIESGHISGAAVELAQVFAFGPSPAGFSGEGPVDLDLFLSGPPASPNLRGLVRFQGNRLAIDSPSVSLRGVTGTILFTDTDLAVKLAATSPALSLRGRLGLTATSPLRLAVAGEAVPVEDASFLLPAGASGSGRIESLALEIRGTRARPEARGTLRFAGVTLRFPDFAQPIEEIRGAVEIAPGGAVRAEDLRLRFAGEELRLAGGYRPSERVFDKLRITADRLDLARILAALPEARRPFPSGPRIVGEIRALDLLLDGPAERTQYQGEATAGGLTLHLPQVDKPVENIQGRIRFSGTDVRTDSITAVLAGFPIYLQGEISLAAGGPMSARFALHRADLPVLLALLPGEAAGLLRPPASLAGTADLTGRIEISGDRVHAEGEIGQGDLRLFDLAFRDVGGEFRYDATGGAASRRRLDLTQMRGDLGNGRTSGDLKLEGRGEEAAEYRLNLSFERLSLATILPLAGTATDRTRGDLTGRLHAEGRWGEAAATRGEGRLRIENLVADNLGPSRGVIRTVRLDPTAGRAPLNGGMTFRIERGEIRTDDLRLASTDLGIGAKGSVRLSGETNLDLEIGLAGGPLGRFLNWTGLSSLFGARGEGDHIRVKGHMTGPISNPQVEIDLGAVERVAGTVTSVFR